LNINTVVENLKIKKMGKNQILILFLCGVLLMIIAIPVKDRQSENQDLPVYEYGDSNEKISMQSIEYAKYLEQELSEILSQMEGAGEVKCMVTLSQSAEQVVEKDVEISDENVTESDSQGGTRTTNQSSRSENALYNSEGNGNPYVSMEISPKVEGVLVIADGGDNSVIVKNITESIQALFGIESHKIRIVKKGG